MKLKKTILTSAIAVALGVAATAQAIVIDPSGKGDALMVPYYSAINGNKTFLTITNTTEDAKSVKIRFREGVGSRDVFDFTLYLSQYDVWSALVFRTGDKVTVATQDTSCTVPDVGVANGTFSTTRIPDDYEGNAVDRVSEGHIEILEMAVLDDSSGDDIYPAVTHVNGTPPGCDVVRKWTADMAKKDFLTAPGDLDSYNPNNSSVVVGTPWATASAGGVDQGLRKPSGGLYAHAAVFNPTDGTYFTYAAEALSGWSGVDHSNGILWFPQNSSGIPELSAYTVDQGLGWDEGADDNGLVEYFDLPDLSTPSAFPNGGQSFIAFQAVINTAGVLGMARTTDGGGMNNPYKVVNPTDISPTPETVMLAIGSDAAAAKRNMVTAALMRGALTNDYITGGGFETEWLVTFPSRYLHVNVEGGVDASGTDLPSWVTAALPFTQVESAKTGEACEVIGFEYWDREEGQVSDPGSIDFSPGGSVPDKFQLCYEVNVMAFNQDAGSSTAVLRSNQVAKYVGLETGYDNGWAKLDFSSFGLRPGNGSQTVSIQSDVTNGSIGGWMGLPVIGFMAVSDTSGDVLRGATFDHHLDPVAHHYPR